MTGWPSFPNAVVLTLSDPAAMARVVMQRRYDRGTLWMGVGLVSCLSIILVLAIDMVTPVSMPLAMTPMMYGIVMASVMIVLSMSLYYTGHMVGGTSTFPHCFALVIWLEMTSFCLRFAQAILGIISPSVALIFQGFSVVVLFWALLHFINETHGFGSLWRAFATLAIAIIGISFGFGFFLAIIGVGAGIEV